MRKLELGNALQQHAEVWLVIVVSVTDLRFDVSGLKRRLRNKNDELVALPDGFLYLPVPALAWDEPLIPPHDPTRLLLNRRYELCGDGPVGMRVGQKDVPH